MKIEQWQIRFFLELLIILIKTGQWRTVLNTIIWSIETKASYDEAMERLKPEYFNDKVKKALEEFKKNDQSYGADPIHVEGYDKYKEAIK